LIAVRRYRVGPDLIALEMTADAGELQGRPRLSPGEIIELLDVPSSRGLVERRAMVESWSVCGLGHGGTIYRGTCRWLESAG